MMKMLIYNSFLILAVCLSAIVRCQYQTYGDNVALNKPASQSSTYSEDGFMFVASLGVDGNISTNFYRDKTCSHTNVIQKSAWWTVDLNGFFFIKFIRIYQIMRQNVYNRLDGSQMYVRVEDSTWQHIQFNSNWPPELFDVNVTLDKRIGSIKLNNTKLMGNNEDTFISICELQAYEVIECSNYSIENGNINVVQHGDSNQTFTYGTKLNVTCHEGYRMSDDGSATNEVEINLECIATGNWSRNLRCSVIDCGRPLNIPGNSTVMFSTGLAGNTSYNATLTVQCNKGFNYTLTGKENIRCGKEGKWDAILGQCEVIECLIIFSIVNGEIKVKSTGVDGKNNTYGVKLTVECDSGFASNVLEITCLDSGLSSQPLCTAVPNSTNLIAVIVGSVVTFITALVIGIVMFVRRRKKNKDDATRNFDQIDESKVGGNNNYAEMDFDRGFKNKKRNRIPDDPTIAHKVIASGQRLEVKEEMSAYEFVEDFEHVKSKSIGLYTIKMEPYDTLQMDNRANSEYDELKFERESSLKIPMKKDTYQTMRPGDWPRNK